MIIDNLHLCYRVLHNPCPMSSFDSQAMYEPVRQSVSQAGTVLANQAMCEPVRHCMSQLGKVSDSQATHQPDRQCEPVRHRISQLGDE